MVTTTTDCLSVGANVVRFVEIPFAGQVMLLASDILTTFQRARNNSKGFQRLEDDIRNLIVALREVEVCTARDLRFRESQVVS
ncbi:hypothetical protein B0H12DRAFT_79529 [Mycena haematopus]|nr:hypothetical protein B0H12DRAFT_79529 [Mycena haematopus]